MGWFSCGFPRHWFVALINSVDLFHLFGVVCLALWFWFKLIGLLVLVAVCLFGLVAIVLFAVVTCMFGVFGGTRVLLCGLFVYCW